MSARPSGDWFTAAILNEYIHVYTIFFSLSLAKILFYRIENGGKNKLPSHFNMP